MEATWSLGVLIGLPVTIIICLLLIALSIYCFTHEEPHMGWVGIGCLALVVAVAGFLYWPWSAEYHRFEPVTGVVAKVDKRLLAAGEGSMEEKIVVRFNGSTQEYGINDTRAALVETGDKISITCKRAWQFAGVDGYDCKWVRMEEAHE